MGDREKTNQDQKIKEILRITHRTEEIKSQEDQVVRWCNTGFPGCFPGLPPSPADIGHFQNLMLGKADLVGVFGVCVVRVDRLGVVWIFGRLWDLSRHIIGLHSSQIVCRRVTEPGCGGVLWASRTARVSGHGGWCFEAVELGRGIHLGHFAGRGLGTIAVSIRHILPLAVPVWPRLLLVESEGIDESTVRGLRARSEIEDPHNLFIR